MQRPCAASCSPSWPANRIRAEIAQVRHELRAEIGQVRTDMGKIALAIVLATASLTTFLQGVL